MKKFSVLLLAVVIILGMAACGSSGGGSSVDTTAPVITLTNPTVDSHIAKDDTNYSFKISGSITDEGAGVTAYTYDFKIKGAAKKFDGSWTAHVEETLTAANPVVSLDKTIEWDGGTTQYPTAGTYVLTITATDAAGNTSAAKTVEFAVGAVK